MCIRDRIKYILQTLDVPAFDDLEQALDPLEDVAGLIDRAIAPEPPISVTDGGVIRDGYNHQLDEYRGAMQNGKQWIADLQEQERRATGINNLKIGYNHVFGYYICLLYTSKEKGIIGQEIRMYADNPDNRLYMGTLGNLYPEDPVKIDIAGSEDSIAKITPELLYQIHRTFYQPGNMNLFVVGNLDTRCV